MDHRGRILDLLQDQVGEMARQTTRSVAAEVAEFGPVRDDQLVEELLSLSSQGIGLLVQILKRQTPPSSEELGFIRERAAYRARQLVPLSAQLHAYLIANRVVCKAISDAAGATLLGNQAALALTAMASEFTLVTTTVMADAYLETVQGDLADLERQRVELLDALLTPGIRGLRDLSRRAAGLGLEPGRTHVAVIAKVSCSPDDGTPEPSQRWAAEAMSRAGGQPNRLPFVVIRGGEVVAILRLSRSEEAEEILARAGSALRDTRGGRLTAGVGPPFTDIDELRSSYEEARRALRHAGPARPFVVGPGQVRVFDELALSAEGSVSRLIPERTRAALEDPILRASLEAFSAANLNVAEAGKALFVHPNTLRYRLRRIADRTGLDPRLTADLLELTASARVMDAQASVAGPPANGEGSHTAVGSG